MRFFTAQDVHAALDLDRLADAIAAVLADAPVAPLRHAHALNDTDSLLLMPAWSAQALGVKLVTVMPGNRARRSGDRQCHLRRVRSRDRRRCVP